MEDFAELFADLEDPRTGNAKRHELHEMVLIALCTVLSGGETCSDMALFGRLKRSFLQEFLTLEHGVPSHDTFSRLFRLLDPAAFGTWFISFMQRFAESCEGVVATMRAFPGRGKWLLLFLSRKRYWALRYPPGLHQQGCYGRLSGGTPSAVMPA